MNMKIKGLKSNMDRFIVAVTLDLRLVALSLKSNMDRFIVITKC